MFNILKGLKILVFFRVCWEITKKKKKRQWDARVD